MHHHDAGQFPRVALGAGKQGFHFATAFGRIIVYVFRVEPRVIGRYLKRSFVVGHDKTKKCGYRQATHSEDTEFFHKIPSIQPVVGIVVVKVEHFLSDICFIDFFHWNKIYLCG